MNYTQIQELFEAMDNLQMYARLLQQEMAREKTDFDETLRYEKQIQVKRELIFKIARDGGPRLID
tara:strand:+ start:974 stop:1168 length:195 start_codon:yes stop_codon:yes gene_type:complete